jgi:outer membrane murein-binding lipoprotein Lpp
MAINKLLGALVLVGLGLVGCDQSKAELDSTKQQLQAVTAERDSLKSQLDATKAQLAAAQQQMDQMKAAQAAPAAQPSGAAAAPAKEHHASKGGTNPIPHDPGVKTEAPPEVKKEQKKQMTGGSSM